MKGKEYWVLDEDKRAAMILDEAKLWLVDQQVRWDFAANSLSAICWLINCVVLFCGCHRTFEAVCRPLRLY